MTFRKKLLFIAFLISSFDASAAVNDFSEYLFTLKAFSQSPRIGLNFKPLDETQTLSAVKYKPNVGNPSGLSLSIAGLFGFSYVTDINEEKVTSDKGNTSYDDYRFTFAYERFLFGISYVRYKGLFIDNTSEVDPSSTDPFIKRPDIEFKNYAVNFAWIFNHKEYSLMALLDQTARQESSGGSWIVGVNAEQTEMSGDSAFVPSSAQSQFGVDATLSKGKFLTGSITVGYGYTHVWSKKYYAGILVLLGTGLQQRELTTSSGTTESSERVEKWDARLGFGYNGDRFFIGMHTSADGTTYKTDSVKIGKELINFEAFIGTHF